MSFDLLLIMSTKLMVTLLDRASNGNEMLAILDTLTAEDDSSEYNEPTLNAIEF